MKILMVMLALLMLILLTGCGQPIVIPADMAITLPPNQDFVVHATAPAITPVIPSETPTLAPTATIPSPTPTHTPSITPTRKPTATRKSPYPANLGEPLIDPGFQVITMENVQGLKQVFSAQAVNRQHAASSGDGQKLFLSTTTGTFLFNRQGEMLAHFPQVLTTDKPCESCIAANLDGSRLAVITRNAGSWEVQVFEILENQATLVLALPVESGYKGDANEASIAISPGNNYLAFKAGKGPLRVLDLESKLQVLEYDRPVSGTFFTADGSGFVVHSGLELLFYRIPEWKFPVMNLLLPRQDTPFTFSPDGRLIAIALPTLFRLYAIDGSSLAVQQEISIPPANATRREWAIGFVDSQNLAGYAVTWDTFKTSGKVETGQWDLLNDSVVRFDSYSVNATDALSGVWGNPIELPTPHPDLESSVAAYPAFRYISDGMLLVNSAHSTCWFKLFTGETTCFKDPENNLFAGDAISFKESRGENSTSLVELRSGVSNLDLGPYQIKAISRNGEWVFIDNGTGTDLYQKGKKLPQESVKGQLQGFAENKNLIVFTALDGENTFTITVVDKATGNAIIQKTDNFLYKPVIMTLDGSIIYTQNELDRNQTVFNRIDPVTLQISEITRISLGGKPLAITLSNNGLLAIGQTDGAVLFMPQNGEVTASIQAAAGPILGLSFSPDGRYLAVASSDGIQVLAVFP